MIETYPAELDIYDPSACRWINDNPWTLNIHLNPNETKTVLYYVLLPEKTGAYALQTELGYMDGGTYTFDQDLRVDIIVDKNHCH
jgi:hypothetical protein